MNPTKYVIESIKKKNLRMRIKKNEKKWRHLQDSYLQSVGYESRVLTNTPWGQSIFAEKLKGLIMLQDLKFGGKFKF